MELLDPEGPTLLDRDEAAMASKELSAQLKMRRLQFGKGDGKGKDLKGNRKGEKGDQERKSATQKGRRVGESPEPP